MCDLSGLGRCNLIVKRRQANGMLRLLQFAEHVKRC